jgi:NADH-quinone oxidoreductase subunit C
MSQKVLDQLEKQFGDAIVRRHSQFGDDTAIVDPKRWKDIALYLRDELSFDHFIDLTAVDWLGRRTPRFEVVLHVRSMDKLHRLRLKAEVDDPTIDSLVEVWSGANWFERECFDMFGVDFVGHPDLRRILMYPEFEGYPLRKDYPAQRTQPLIPYREGANNDKLPPFDEHMGLPFGRQTHDVHVEAGQKNALGFEEDN